MALYYNATVFTTDSNIGFNLGMCILYMVLQVAPSRESYVANTTTIRRVISMDMHVKFQIRQFVESFLAQRTLVWFFASVNQYVITQIAFLVKAFPATIADKFLLDVVRSQVGLKRRRTIECFLANVALIRFFLGMNNFVPAQCGRQTKALSTSIAHKRPCKGMIWHF